jgi:hypothetical protein
VTALEHADVNDLLEEMKTAPEIYRPSPFWQELTAVGLQQLEGGRFENFKRSVNMAYFNWSVPGILQHQFPLMRWRPQWGVLGPIRRYRDRRCPRLGLSVRFDYRLRLPDASFNPAAAFFKGLRGHAVE